MGLNLPIRGNDNLMQVKDDWLGSYAKKSNMMIQRASVKCKIKPILEWAYHMIKIIYMVIYL